MATLLAVIYKIIKILKLILNFYIRHEVHWLCFNTD